MADGFSNILRNRSSRGLLGLDGSEVHRQEGVAKNLERLTQSCSDIDNFSHDILSIGSAALHAFLQANVTGPPLDWNVDAIVPSNALLPLSDDPEDDIRSRLLRWLSVDGEAVYQHLPYAELLVYAKILLNAPNLSWSGESLQARLRVNTWHQRLLNQPSPELEQLIYRDVKLIENDDIFQTCGRNDLYAEFLLEKAAIHLLHGFDGKIREALQQAAQERSFEFLLTGRLGKRTKFQQKDISQLVVLAKSSDPRANENGASPPRDLSNPLPSYVKDSGQPNALRLEDDTLLESIAFRHLDVKRDSQPEDNALPSSLVDIDPGNQPLLHPLDAIILIITASSITNTTPADGMTREETLPYAERVISGGSSNWQVYTQALLVRSRIEGYKSRTVERGVLQLQALVDQVIAETTGVSAEPSSEPNGQSTSTSTFLPRLAQSEAAPADQRLQYIHQLASPPRWKLESELADKWVSMGALRTALEIYERLQLWAEAALCMAAEGKDRKARNIIRRCLYQMPKSRGDSVADISEGGNDAGIEMYTVERKPLPADAPRLFCILGDLEALPSAYERAWEISNYRFARAQRSLGKYYLAKDDTAKADEAYTKSLKANPQNHATWFALGCVRLQTENWPGAVDAFGRAVQIEDDDAESWSNLAVSLLRMPDENSGSQQNARGAFVAMKRATSIKRDNAKLWQNLLAIAIQLSPPPYPDIVMAQSRLIDLLSPSQGEAAVDIPVMDALLAHVLETDQLDPETATTPSPSTRLGKLVKDLITKQIAPLITSSRPLWLLVAKLNIYLKRPLAALNTYEKAWRSAVNQPEWETSRKQWEDVSDATVELMDAYESLGERARESGLSEGEMVAKDWKFKARSAARSVLAKAKEGWGGDEAYNLLQERLQALKSA